MGRRAAELVGVLVASILTSFVTGLATAGPGEPLLYFIGAAVPLALLLAYWLWVEPRAEAERLRSRRLEQAVEDAFDLAHPATDAPRDQARRAYYDRLEIPDLFEANHIEAWAALGAALDSARQLLNRLDADPSGSVLTDLDAWEARAARDVEIFRGPSDTLVFRYKSTEAPDAAARRKRLADQIQLLELWVGDERKRAGDQAKDRFRA